MENPTTVYVNLGNGQQMKVEMTLQAEPLPTPNETTREREPSDEEFHTAACALKKKSFFYKPLF